MSRRICHIAKATGISGSEKHLTILLPELVKAGWDVSFGMLVEPRNPVSEFAHRLEAGGVYVRRLAIRGDVDPLLFWKLYRLLRREKYDLVHTHLIHADLYGTLGARLAGVPIVLSSRHAPDEFRRQGFYNLLNRIVTKFVDHVVVISDSLKSFTMKYEGVEATKITRIYYGLHPDGSTPQSTNGSIRKELSLEASTPLLGVVGRLYEMKGHRYLLDGFPQILKAMPETRLLIIGDGPLKEKLASYVERMGIANRVVFTGRREDVTQVVKELDVIVMPSLWEGFGLVLLEAMAAARPIVASGVGAIPEIVIHGETGLLVPPKDPGALADAILTVLKDLEMAQELGRKGRQRLLQEFSVEKMVSETEQVYLDLLRKKRRTAEI